ncbi:hypothetical protein [Microvirga sp. BSC39]|uniref:hypothetical protein n=1 Tax=Microvirga sp. BSC39 TaxID=1549810 RepID=UPI0004E97D60|nr:hypothetical protein [Microvirga sp. BSC39]KFG69238.1 hypothetical protein JH26_13795 [Microvirga sp. BSC39]
MRVGGYLLLWGALLAGAPASGQEASRLEPVVTACDRLAAMPGDLSVPPGIDPVYEGLLDAPLVKIICEAAVEIRPDMPRLRHALGRANLHLGEHVIAKENLLKAADGGHAYSLTTLG